MSSLSSLELASVPLLCMLRSSQLCLVVFIHSVELPGSRALLPFALWAPWG